MLSQEAGRADANRHYGFYIDGDIAKLPGGMYYIFYSGPSEGGGTGGVFVPPPFPLMQIRA